jgi:lambda repressor-like predicted transcriptional regulator
MDIVDSQLALLRDEWLKGIDGIAREVWQIQGKALTPGFVRDVLLPNAMGLIGSREGVTQSSLERAQRSHLSHDSSPARHHLAMEIRRLRGEMANRYEIEARELDYRKVPSAQGEILDKAPSPFRDPVAIDPASSARTTLPNAGATTEVAMVEKYPRDFPTESRAKVEAARIRAGRRFDSDKAKAKWRSDIEVLFRNYLLTIFLTFAKEAASFRLWPENCQDFLRLLTIEVYFQKGKAAGLRDMISDWNGSILWEFQQELEKTPQWRSFENILLKLAKEPDGNKQPESSHSQNNVDGQIADPAGNKRQSFVLAILESKGWSTHQFSIEAQLDSHTVSDFLKGKTKPNRSTRKRLADALGIAVNELPK